jgi:hypothetical protein
MASPLKRTEQAAGLKAYALRFFGLEISQAEALEALDLMDNGSYASRDLPGIVHGLRLHH